MVKTLVGLDIGDSKIVCLIGELNENNGAILLKSVGIKETKGFKNNTVIDTKVFSKVVEEAIYDAEKIYNSNVRDIFVNITGNNIYSSIISIEKSADIDGNITKYDVYDISKEIINKFESNDKEVIQTILISSNQNDIFEEHNVDNNNTKKIKYVFNVIYTKRSKLDILRSIFKKMNINIVSFVCNACASAQCFINEDCLKKIILIMDIGFNTTDFCVMQSNKIIFNDSIPLAGMVLTQDIATILKVPFQLAEEIKIKNVTLTLDPFEEKDYIKFDMDGGEESFRAAKHNKKFINDIFFARFREIIVKIKNILKEKGLLNKVDSAIITGGGSNVFGIENYVENILNKKTIKGFIEENISIGDILDSEKIKNPIYSTAIGLLLFDAKIFKQQKYMTENSSITRFGIFVNKILRSLINLFIS